MLHRLSATWESGPLRFEFRVDNAGDAEVFDLYGWPLPGRRVALSVGAGGIHAR